MFALLALPWVRKCLEGTLALTAISYSLYDRGVHAEQQAEKSLQVQASKRDFERIESAFAQELSAANATADKYHDLVAVLLQQSEESATKARLASAAEIADKQKLTGVPDSKIQQDLESKLGGELTSPAILRLDDSIVTDYPHLKDQQNALVSQVIGLQSAQEASERELTAVEAQRDARITAYNALLPLYAQAYNAAVPRHRHFWCLWLCRSKPLVLPAPVPLHPITKAP